MARKTSREFCLMLARRRKTGCHNKMKSSGFNFIKLT